MIEAEKPAVTKKDDHPRLLAEAKLNPIMWRSLPRFVSGIEISFKRNMFSQISLTKIQRKLISTTISLNLFVHSL